MHRLRADRSKECTICLEEFRNPRYLPCGHTFCSSCLQQLINTYDPIYMYIFRGFRCPLCRNFVAIPQQGFPRDMDMVNLLANRRTAPNADEVLIEESDRIPTDNQRVDVSANRRSEQLGSNADEEIQSMVTQQLLQRIDDSVSRRIGQSGSEVPFGGARRPARGPESANRQSVQTNTSSNGYYVALVVLIIAILIHLRFQFEMDKERDAWSFKRRKYELSEAKLKTEVKELKVLLVNIEDSFSSKRKSWSNERRTYESSQEGYKTHIQNLVVALEKLQYASNPVASKTFQLEPTKGRAVVALALLDGKLLYANVMNGDLKSRDAHSLTTESIWAKVPSYRVAGMGICREKGEVFISTWDNYIMRFKRNGQMLDSWPVETVASGVISVTDDCSVILAVRDSEKQILTYSPYGERINRVVMEADILDSRLMKAVQISHGRYIVSYGKGRDKVHGIDIINANGQTLESFDGVQGARFGQLTDPRDFVVDRSGNILVLDNNEGVGRIVLLDSELNFLRAIVPTKPVLQEPFAILLSECDSLLYVADNKWDAAKKQWTDGRILVLKLR